MKIRDADLATNVKEIDTLGLKKPSGLLIPSYGGLMPAGKYVKGKSPEIMDDTFR